MKKKKWQIEYAPGFWESANKCFSSKLKYAIPRWFNDRKYQIKWGWQRLTRGYDDRYNWELCGMLEWLIPKCVRWMAKNHYGCPSNLFDKTNKRNQCWKWTIVLKKIAEGFEATEKIHQEWLFKGKRYEKLKKRKEEGMKLFIKYFENLWD